MPPYTLPIDQILSRTSALRRIPANLEPNQRLCLDAIRCSIEAIGLCYGRLVVEAIAIEQARLRPGARSSMAMFVDSWALVDWVHRLHDLVAHTPRMKNSPAKELFLRETESVDRLRNAFQHVVGEYAKGTRATSSWGSIAWFFTVDQNHARSCMTLIGGVPSDAQFPIVNPSGYTRTPVDHFELTAFGETGSLSKWFDAVTAFAHSLEKAVETMLAGLGDEAVGRVADVTVFLDMEFGS